ncbi:hypothetical protein K474DRAFT_1735062 [Panus rudis PR-1116 ss-1]|nr:hypothetical protein K474DRAFT_1735062 [Panus rudis PR-1116 ss-1]
MDFDKIVVKEFMGKGRKGKVYILKTGRRAFIKHECRIWQRLQSRGYVPLLIKRTKAVMITERHQRVVDAMVLHEGIVAHLIEYPMEANVILPLRPGAGFILAYIGFCLIKCLKFLHQAGVLHRDVHPGNVIYMRRPPSAELGAWHELPSEAFYLFDFGHSLLDGHHPTIPSNQPSTNATYGVHNPSSREYSARDDLEMLAYTLVAFHRCSHPAWVPFFSFPSEDEDISQVRSRTLDRLLEGAPPVVSEFVTYARNLECNSVIDYDGWAKRFYSTYDDMPPHERETYPHVDPSLFL